MGRPLKLTRVQIKEICLSTDSSRDLAKRFGVSYITILNYRKKYGKQVQQGIKASPDIV
jgi:transposase